MNPRIASVAAALAAVAVGVSVAGCGEHPQVARYEDGKYAGTRDARPWEGGAFNGDKTAWEQALRNRARHQNEYKRTE